METAVAERGTAALNATSAIATMEGMNVIRKFVAEQLKEGTDYGSIPGTDQRKKVLLLPGAQKVNMLFNCWPRYVILTTDLGGGHTEFLVTTELVHRQTDAVIGSGVGSCSTMESKYRYRNSNRKCPKCGKECIIKGKAEYGGGFLCFAKKGGCGAKFGDTDKAITDQAAGRVENEDIADVRNTVLKIAKKRSLVDSSIGLACLTELFTADLEDQPDRGGRDDTDSGPHEPPEHTNHVPTGPPPVVQQWRDWLAKDPSLAQLNGAVPTLLRHRNSPDESLRVIWTDVTAFAKKCGRGFNERANTFDSLTDGL